MRPSSNKNQKKSKPKSYKNNKMPEDKRIWKEEKRDQTKYKNYDDQIFKPFQTKFYYKFKAKILFFLVNLFIVMDLTAYLFNLL